MTDKAVLCLVTLRNRTHSLACSALGKTVSKPCWEHNAIPNLHSELLYVVVDVYGGCVQAWRSQGTTPGHFYCPPRSLKVCFFYEHMCGYCTCTCTSGIRGGCQIPMQLWVTHRGCWISTSIPLNYRAIFVPPTYFWRQSLSVNQKLAVCSRQAS